MAALSLPLSSMALTLMKLPMHWVDLLFDDAYYYLGVARNLATEGRSMFAPPLETNGYQPLWLGLLTFAAFFVGGDRQLLAAAAHLLIFAAIVVFLVLSKRQQGRAWPAALVVLSFPWVTTSGLETVLILPLALLYFGAQTWQWRGTWSALLFLARLDAIGLIIGRAVYRLIVHREFAWREHAVLLGVAAAYLLFNHLAFGTPVPVSGLAKAIGSVPGENWRVATGFLIFSVPVAVAGLQLVLMRGDCALFHVEPIVASTISVMCSALYYSILSGWTVWFWYYWPIVLLTYFVLSDLVATKPIQDRRLRVLTNLGRALGLLVLADYPLEARLGYEGRYADKPEFVSYGEQNVAMAQSVNRSSLATGTTFAMGDRAGSLGYLLDGRFHFIQVEGIVGSMAYIRAMRQDRGEEFLERHGVDLLVVDRDRLWRESGLYVMPEPAQPKSARVGQFILCFEEEAIERGIPIERPERLVFQYGGKVACPEAVVQHFRTLRTTYGAMHAKSF